MALDAFQGDLSQIPVAVDEMKKLPVHELKDILKFYGIPWSGSKDEIVLRVLVLRTGNTHLLLGRERQALIELITIAKHLINAQRELDVISNEFLVRRRAFSTPEGPKVSEDRPRETAGRPAIPHEKVLVPSTINMKNLEEMFDYLLGEIRLVNTREKRDPYTLEAIRKCGAKVMVRWLEDDERRGWTPGRYGATVVGYVRDDDCIEVEYSSEPGRSYRMNVEESVGDGKLCLHKITCTTTDVYEEVTEIGAGILVRLTEEDLKGSGWRPGWYVAEVQSFDRESDEINIIYDREPDELYVECVTTLITEGRVKPR